MIARGDGTPLYNLAVAVDDAEMGITDVIRGDDHLSNTPKQVLVLEALGVAPPRYAHLPLLHGPDGKKLSKRHGAASVQELRDAGFLPAAVRNYLALLGWGAEDDTTILSTEELVERFDIERVGRASAVFDERKLRWLNGRYMRELPLDGVCRGRGRGARASGPRRGRRRRERLAAACAIAQDKAQTLDEVWPLVRFLFEEPVDDPKAWAKVMAPDAMPEALATSLEVLRAAASPSTPAGLERELRRCRRASGVKPKRRSISQFGWRSPARPSRRGSSSRSRCSAASGRAPGSTPRSPGFEPSAGQTADPG